MLTYDASFPAERQATAWNCSCCTTCWMLQSLGLPVTEAEITNEMVARGLVSPALGLLDGSGAGIAAFVAEKTGVPAHSAWFYATDADWAWLQQRAGRGPIGLGSNTMYHWLAIRAVEDEYALAGMNPAPSYLQVGDQITYGEYMQWAPWAGVWLDLEAPPEENDVADTEALMACQNQVGYLTVDVANAIQKELDVMRAAHAAGDTAGFNSSADAQQAAINTLRTGG